MLTDEQRANLRKLAEYLLGGRLRLDFDMAICYSDAEEPYHTCGTVGCAIGHGPDAGIAPLNHESWPAYEHRVFGGGDAEVYFWCFHGEWDDVDNTPEGAAKRILWMLEHGVPEDWKAQMMGNAPLCYWSMETKPRDMMAIFAPAHVEAE